LLKVYQIKTPRPKPGYFLFFYRTRAQTFSAPGTNFFQRAYPPFFSTAPALLQRARTLFSASMPPLLNAG